MNVYLVFVKSGVLTHVSILTRVYKVDVLASAQMTVVQVEVVRLGCAPMEPVM